MSDLTFEDFHMEVRPTVEYFGPPLPLNLLYRRMAAFRDAIFEIGEAFGDDEPIGDAALREMGFIP